MVEGMFALGNRASLPPVALNVKLSNATQSTQCFVDSHAWE